MSFLEYVKLEFSDFNNLSSENWERKINEYYVLEQLGVNVEQINNIESPTMFALKIAIETVHFKREYDAERILKHIIKLLTGIPINKDLSAKDIESLYKLIFKEYKI